MTTRENIKEYLGSNLYGPRGGVDELIKGRVHLQYMLGVLFAQDATLQGLGTEESESEAEDAEENSISGENQSAGENSYFHDSFSRLPSSAGLSVCVEKGCSVKIELAVGVYEKVEDADDEQWQRREITDSQLVAFGAGGTYGVLEGRASLRVLFRGLASGKSVATFTLVNEQSKDGRGQDPSTDLFQVSMRCVPSQGDFPPYPATEIHDDDPDALELAFTLRDSRPFAIGHGASVNWQSSASGAEWVELDYLPSEYVGRPVFDDVLVGNQGFANQQLFSLAYLSDPETPVTDLVAGLNELVDFYEAWLSTLDNEEVPEVFSGVVSDRVKSIASAIKRMRSGIKMLESDENRNVLESFRLANYSMLIQMIHAGVRKQGPFARGDAPDIDTDYLQQSNYRWRPFQLGFMLLVMASVVDDDDDYRELVDVIWFSTGGGKTEAYLLVTAFILVHRRLEHGVAGCGTAVMNRYTYRFLTADQFDRTAGLACALERIRAGNPRLMEVPFTVGLWVGGELTPNRYRHAEDAFSELLETVEEDEVKNAFQIETCPDCGTRLFPASRVRSEEGDDDLSLYGFRAGAAGFSCFCPSEICMFHAGLPLSMVDDDLYRNPPSFLIGTIDKFAMLPWTSNAGVFLGFNSDCRPPSLIIQDELHLISGPLGTLAGVYEAALETVIRSKANGAAPKIIASTATIRNAAEQCKRLYARDTAVFPSPGLQTNDSFFARVDESIERSRMYIGVMGQGVTNTIAVYWSIAAFLQAVNECEMTEQELDAYWTLLAYHNSKRELGRTRNAVSDEISDRIKVYCEIEEDQRHLAEPLEISSNAVKSVATARARLSTEHTTEIPAVDVVPCTNMISVGIDIDRLGAMFVNGQPKLTSEYIQATSRVGRKNVPGIVLTCLSPSKPRDRSHYESFKFFHSVMAAYVEPTSVTPGSIPATERALHAGLVMVVRFAAGLSDNLSANDFDSNNPNIKRYIDLYRERLCKSYSADDFEFATIESVLQERVRQWERWRDPDDGLHYKANDKNSRGILYEFSKPRRKVGWPTLMSMRHVDSEVDLEAS
ncbi:helicase-related protein [Pseudomonadales bacterium]|nr:helicase-related protein [Pseudomonadales bacterium]